MKVESELSVYEVNGKETVVGDDKKLLVKSAWNRRRCVVLEFEGKNITVDASDLEKAIRNATNI